MAMWEEIEKRGHRYQELKGFLEDPNAPTNPQYPNWLREHGRLGKFGELWEEYTSARKQIAEAESILAAADSDSDLKTLAMPSETVRDFLRQMEAQGYGSGGGPA